MSERVVSKELSQLDLLIIKVSEMQEDVKRIKEENIILKGLLIEKKKYITAKELAHYLGKPLATVRQIHQKLIPYIKDGKSVYFRMADVHEYLESKHQFAGINFDN